jgi:hypothetical protein
MKTEVVNVTPSKAESWLLRNRVNRPLRQGWVKQLAAMIQRGEWKLTHQGIAFFKNGDMADGQHRASAIVTSGLTVPVMVTYDVPDDGFHAMDLGAKRSLSDTLGISKDLAAVARFLASIEDTLRGGGFSPQFMVPYVTAVDPYLTDLMAFTPSHSKAWSATAVRSAAVVRMMDGEDADYVKLVYHTLVHGEFDSMPPIAHSLVRQYISGGLLSHSPDMFVRCLKVFDQKNRDVSRLQVSRLETDIGYARDVIARHVHGVGRHVVGQKKAPAAKASGAKKTVNVGRNYTALSA